MKKDKLYTVTKGNKGIINNTYPDGGNLANPFSKGNLMKTFSKDGLGNLAKGAAGQLINLGAGLVGGLAGNAISGGLESGAGSAIGSIGSTAGSIVGTVNPVLGAAVGVGSQLVGGLVNRAFGTSVDEAALAANNEGTAALANFSSNATSLDNIQGPAAVANVQDAYKGGILNSSSAASKNEEMRRQRALAESWANRSVENNVDNILGTQMADILSNYSSFGGHLNMKDKKNVGIPAFIKKPFALGGVLQSHGGDFSDGLVHIDNGGTHEENINDGVQMGVDNEGTPNLVEEGETVYNDYVFSNRILADDATKQMFKLPKKRDITFADISKKLEKEVAERVNDPISQAGFKAQMQALEEQQERQKQEMEAERARAAFEALSPEEQTAVMQNAAQQEAMAQQAAQEQAIAEQQAMQQPSPEEVAMMQQQAMQADGSQAVVGQEAPMMAEGGNLFRKGGYKWDSFWTPVNEYSKKQGKSKDKYQIDKDYKGDIKELEGSDAYKAFTDYIINNATDEERLNYFKWIDANTGKENKYLDKDGKLVEGWQEAYKNARNDGLYGIQHYTPEFDPELMVATTSNQPNVAATPTGRVFHAMDGGDYLPDDQTTWVNVGDEVGRQVLDNGDTVIYHAPKAGVSDSGTGVSAEENTTTVSPRHRNENLRYAGLFGPAVGLGMQALGIGRPDYGRLDAVANNTGNVALANYKPIGNYLTYRPIDIWYAQNAMNAQARATDRAISNSNTPSSMAGLLANGYNSQIASGNLYRQALESNNAQRERVEAFNRGTNQFNADAFNRLSMFNAGEQNRGRQYDRHLQMEAARQRLAGDAAWNQGIYGNVSGLFKGASDLGRENAQFNWLADLAADDVFGTMGKSNTGKRWVNAKGGKLKKRGLTI